LLRFSSLESPLSSDEELLDMSEFLENTEAVPDLPEPLAEMPGSTRDILGPLPDMPEGILDAPEPILDVSAPQVDMLEPIAEMAAESASRLERCEWRIGYVFQDKALLREALTHASGAEHRLASNERLEFLGDAILGAVVCELLFERYPRYLEGDLTKIKSAVVSRQSCAKISEALGLQEFLIVGKGVSACQPIPPSLLADVFESLVAGIYLDGGHEAARKFIEELMGPEIDLTATGELSANYKSLLQQFAQREFSSTPIYQLLDEKGPDHRKCFKVAVHVGGVLYQAAWGRNKKEAEQRAACNALAEINGEPAQFPCD
jgi:ribonuclease-3